MIADLLLTDAAILTMAPEVPMSNLGPVSWRYSATGSCTSGPTMQG